VELGQQLLEHARRQFPFACHVRARPLGHRHARPVAGEHERVAKEHDPPAWHVGAGLLQRVVEMPRAFLDHRGGHHDLRGRGEKPVGVEGRGVLVPGRLEGLEVAAHRRGRRPEAIVAESLQE
ncbi:MAG: hypothetical protein ACK56I_03075, partial [bacterium]